MSTNLMNSQKIEKFDPRKISQQLIDEIFEFDEEGKDKTSTLKKYNAIYKEHLKQANVLFSSQKTLNFHFQFQIKKSFYNHKDSLQELLRSQHIYKLIHELKYTPSKNSKPYADLLEDATQEVLRLNDQGQEIQESLEKWTLKEIDMIKQIRNDLQREQYKLISCKLQNLQDLSDKLNNLIQISEEAISENENLLRQLNNEKFFKDERTYFKKNLPEFSMNASSELIIEKTFQKRLKNFQYITTGYLKRYFNEFNNQALCGKKIKKLRLINDYLPLKVQLDNVMNQCKFENVDFIKINQLRQNYLLAPDLPTIMQYLSSNALKMNITEDINIDNGCLLLFSIDKFFQTQVAIQSDQFLQFHPYDLNSPFVQDMLDGNNVKKKTAKERAQQLMNIIDKEKLESKKIKVRSSGAWIDKLQIVEEQSAEDREQDSVLEQYEDTFVYSWLKFLLFNQQELINNKIEKDMSVLEERATKLHQNDVQQFPSAYFEFYRRNFKLLYMHSRENIIKIMSYLNYFRVTQKNLNLLYVELIIGQSIEGTQMEDSKKEGKPNKFNPLLPLDQQIDVFVRGQNDEKFLLTNPGIAHFGNLSNYSQNSIAYKVSQGSKSDYTKQGANNIKPVNMNEPNILYEEERIQFENDEYIKIFDHNNMQIIYDSSIHDFFELLKKISQICSFFFQVDQKNFHKQKQTSSSKKDIFEDNFDRESLIDSILSLEKQYQLQKCKLLYKLVDVAKRCFTADLRNQLIQLIAKIMARRPRLSLFENKVFECYHYEIQNMKMLQEIVVDISGDLQREEDSLFFLKKKLNFPLTDKTSVFYYEIKNQSIFQMTFYMRSLVKLFLNMEESRKQIGFLIQSGRSNPKTQVTEILKCEHKIFIYLRDYAQKCIFDGDGITLIKDYQEFKFIESDPILDQKENFDLIQTQISNYVNEKYTKQEQNQFQYDAFTIIEFQKLRKKFMNYLFGMTFIMEIYKQQISIYGKQFAEKFDKNIDTTYIGGAKNYAKMLLELDQVKIWKEIQGIDDWIQTVIKFDNIQNLIQPLQALITTTFFAISQVTQNSLYIELVKEEFPSLEQFQQKLLLGQDLFRNIFDFKRKISIEALNNMRKKELQHISKLERLGKQFGEDSPNVKAKRAKYKNNKPIPNYSEIIKRELQYETLKIHTILQRNFLERFQKKLPFEKNLFQFQQMSKLKGYQLKESNQKKTDQSIQSNYIKEEVESNDFVFFDSVGKIINLTNIPSIETILQYNHEDFESILRKAHIILEDSDYMEIDEEENQEWENSYRVGGNNWFKKQKEKLDKMECIWAPHDNVTQGLSSKYSKGFQTHEFFRHKELVYLKKTQLFVIFKTFSSLMNILTLQMFIVSLEANNQDILYFHNGLLGSGNRPPQRKNQATGFVTQIEQNQEIHELQRNELRLRKDLEDIRSLVENIFKNITNVHKNKNIIDSNEAIICYLDKLENRLFLTIIYILIAHLNKSREREDYQLLHRLRSMLINLNFAQIKNLARFPDGRILVSKRHDLEQDKEEHFEDQFMKETDKVLFENSSDYMNMIRQIFWDKRINVTEKLHSTIMNILPTHYFYQESLKFCHILDKSLIGIPQSRTTELSTTYVQIRQEINDFMRNIFVFEHEDIFKYERMMTKLVNLNVRMYILKEIYMVRKNNIFPLEHIPPQNDFLKLKVDKIIEKLDVHKQESMKQKQQKTYSSIQTSTFDLYQTPIWKTIQKLQVYAFELYKTMIDEGLEFYHQSNLIFSKAFQTEKAKNEPVQAIQQFRQGNQIEVDLIGILSSYSSQLFFDSVEIKTLNKDLAIVISQNDLRSHQHTLNLNLLELINQKYFSQMQSLEQKCSILENDIIFQKQENSLMQKKVEFLEINMMNMVEALVAQRTNELQFEIDKKQKLLEKYEREDEVRETRLVAKIKQQFLEQIRDGSLKYTELEKNVSDYKRILSSDVKTYIDRIRDDNFKQIKDSLIENLKDYGGSTTTIHIIDKYINENQQSSQFQEEHNESKDKQQIQDDEQQSPKASNNQVDSKKEPQNTSSPVKDTNIREGLLDNMNVFEQIQIENKHVYQLYQSFKKLRFFYNFREACLREKQDKQIQKIYANNSSNEELFRKISELQKQNDNLREELTSTKKTIGIMQYQNDVLRRDVRRGRSEKINMFKTKLKNMFTIDENQDKQRNSTNFTAKQSKQPQDLQLPQAVISPAYSTQFISSQNRPEQNNSQNIRPISSSMKNIQMKKPQGGLENIQQIKQGKNGNLQTRYKLKESSKDEYI